MNRPAWIDQAFCRECDPEAWSLPDGETHHLTQENHLAIRICETCPVIQHCAAYALTEWPMWMIHAGVPIRRGRHDKRSAASENKLRAIVGAA